MTLDIKYLSHASNIAHKRKIASSAAQRARVEEAATAYDRLLGFLKWQNSESGWLTPAVEALNDYTALVKSLEKDDKFFNWRSDFASSLLPEFLCRVTHERLTQAGISPLFSTRESVVALTLSGSRDGGWAIRRKNQDLCVGLRTESVDYQGQNVEFVVPVVAMEAKTNIDINKLNGLDFSAERLKRSFPASKYFLVTETLDFDLSKNYAGSIDEIYVLRKQKRASARKKREPYVADVFEQFAEDVLSQMRKADVSRRHVYDRLENGRLINV